MLGEEFCIAGFNLERVPAAKYFRHPTTTAWSGPNLHQIGAGLRGAGTPSRRSYRARPEAVHQVADTNRTPREVIDLQGTHDLDRFYPV